MNLKALLFALGSLLFAASASAQWQSETYTLKNGYNAIYLHGDADWADLVTMLPAEVQKVWRWNPNPNQVQFTETPLIASPGTPEWNVWDRSDPGASTLANLTGQSAYLVECAGITSGNLEWILAQSHRPPSASWVRAGANLLGFPTFKNGAAFPTMAQYFATFPAAIAANAKVFKYVGGPLGPANPLQVFSPSMEPLDRTQAYWFSSEVVGNFYAPVEVTFSVNGGLEFGRTGNTVTMRVRNRTAAPATLSLETMNSEARPSMAVEAVTAAVPLTLRKLVGQSFVFESITSGSDPVVLNPNTTTELIFGVDRSHASMTAAADSALFASFLRLRGTFQGGQQLMDILIPARARKATAAGLWLGDIFLSNVSSVSSNPAKAVATVADGAVVAVAVEGTGGFGYTSAPIVTVTTPTGGTAADISATVENGAVTSFTINNGGSGYTIAPSVTVAPPPPLPGTGTPREMTLRTLMHIDDGGNARLLSKVFLGQLAVAPNDLGIATAESALKADALETARRLVSVHLPPNFVSAVQPFTSPGTVSYAVTLATDDATNPFLHQYHPDHDNLDARFALIDLPSGKTNLNAALSDGVEVPAITRTCTFTFTASPPPGSQVSTGWGGSVIGGTYSETLTGLHKIPLTVNGRFELRRVSEIGTLTQP